MAHQSFFSLVVSTRKDLLTFKEVGSKPGFVDRSVGHKLEPQLVGAAFHVVRLSIAAEAAEQRAAL